MKQLLVVAFIIFVAAREVQSVWPEKNPAEAVRSFYAWYVTEFIRGARPLERERDEIKKYVTDKLLAKIDRMPKGPGGLDGDFFLNAQEADPDWAKNIAVGNWYVGRTMSKLGLVLTGKKLGDRQFELKLLFQDGAWKIDELKYTD